MEFQKIIKVSENEVIEEICDYYSNEKTLSFIKQILPQNPYGRGHDVDFLSTLMIDISNKMVKSLDGEEGWEVVGVLDDERVLMKRELQ